MKDGQFTIDDGLKFVQGIRAVEKGKDERRDRAFNLEADSVAELYAEAERTKDPEQKEIINKKISGHSIIGQNRGAADYALNQGLDKKIRMAAMVKDGEAATKDMQHASMLYEAGDEEAGVDEMLAISGKYFKGATTLQRGKQREDGKYEISRLGPDGKVAETEWKSTQEIKEFAEKSILNPDEWGKKYIGAYQKALSENHKAIYDGGKEMMAPDGTTVRGFYLHDVRDTNNVDKMVLISQNANGVWNKDPAYNSALKPIESLKDKKTRQDMNVTERGIKEFDKRQKAMANLKDNQIEKNGKVYDMVPDPSDPEGPLLERLSISGSKQWKEDMYGKGKGTDQPPVEEPAKSRKEMWARVKKEIPNMDEIKDAALEWHKKKVGSYKHNLDMRKTNAKDLVVMFQEYLKRGEKPEGRYGIVEPPKEDGRLYQVGM